MFEVYICRKNIEQFEAQLQEGRPDRERSIIRGLLEKERAKLQRLSVLSTPYPAARK